MKTQKIKRSELGKIYPTLCNDWQKEIFNLVLFQEGADIEVQEDLILKAYEAADKGQKDWLNEFFKVKSIKIQDRVKTWKDVLNEANVLEGDILPYKSPKTKEQISQNAFAKIQLISKVLNEGWISDFTNSNQSKYYPYFKKNQSGSGWSVDSYFSWDDNSSDGYGSHFKTSELALYVGAQFIDIYNDWLSL